MALLTVPLCRQATSYTCGPAALQSILGYYNEEYQEDYLAYHLHTKVCVGTDFRDILSFCHHISFKASFEEFGTISILKKYIDQSIPVLILLQAWSAVRRDYTTSWGDGHYVVACGYDEHNILFMDPSTLGHYTYIPNQEFLNRWHLEDSYGVYDHAYMIIKKQYSCKPYNPKLLKYLG